MMNYKNGRRTQAEGSAFLKLFAAGLLALAAWGYMRNNGSAGESGSGGFDADTPFLIRARAGNPAPPFRARSLAGQAINFPNDYRGKIVLVDFWATWCGPCVAEFPRLIEAYEKFHDRGLEIVGISLDNPGDGSAKKVSQFLSQRGATWAVIHSGADRIAGDYRVNSIPRAFLIDGDTGNIIASDNQTRGPRLLEIIERMLNEKAAN